MRAVFLTGATGLVGGGVLERLLRAHPRLRMYALARDPARLAGWSPRLVPVAGDLLRPGLGVEAGMRARLARQVGAVLHFAADTEFSQSEENAREVNVRGTERVLELAAEWPGVERVVFASTAFVAGRAEGHVTEEVEPGAGWVNAYEWSKHQAEARVRGCGRAWTILRPSTLVFDAGAGVVRQVNAVHRSLRLWHSGLAPMIPGTEDTPVDVVPSDWICDAVARLALHPDTAGRTLHLCAGQGALPLWDLLELTHGVWARSAEWRRRSVSLPALADLETYRLFESSVLEAGDARLARVVRSLSHFVPQLAHPKHFDTSAAEALLEEGAPPARAWWGRMLEHLAVTRWAAAQRAAA